MIRSLKISNFKSIVGETIEFGRFNVFIGANGSGKTNILEAVAMAAAGEQKRLAVEDLLLRGVRVTRPAMTLNAFDNENPNAQVELIAVADSDENELMTLHFSISAPTPATVGAGWVGGLRAITPGPKLSQRLQKHLTERNEKLKRLSAQERVEFSLNPDPLGLGEILGSFGIYAAETAALRGLGAASHREPVGLHGENLDVLLAELERDDPEAYQLVIEKAHLVSWLADVLVDVTDTLKLQGHKIGRSTSRLYFRDRYIPNPSNVLSAENANEGVLHLLFYLALFVSKRTPGFFAIDNIETGLNPRLCTRLVQELANLAKVGGKQALVVTHSPAILDGMNLHDDDERLFEVYRDDDGHTKTRRIKLKPDVQVDGKRLKLSELWMRGNLGAIPSNF